MKKILLLIAITFLLNPSSSQAAENDTLNSFLSMLLKSNDSESGRCPADTPQTVDMGEFMWTRCDGGYEYSFYSAWGYCDDLTLNGYTDWYLPDPDKLKDLVTCTNTTDVILWEQGCDDWIGEYTIPTISENYTCHPNVYWAYTDYTEDGKSVDFVTGKGLTADKDTERHNVRCIRYSACDNLPTGSETITKDGLMWAKCDNGLIGLGSSDTYCNELDLQGYTDWTVPSSSQLFSLVECTNTTEAIHSSEGCAEYPGEYVKPTISSDFKYGPDEQGLYRYFTSDWDPGVWDHGAQQISGDYYTIVEFGTGKVITLYDPPLNTFTRCVRIP